MLHSASGTDDVGVHIATKKYKTEQSVNKFIDDAMASRNLSRLTITDPEGHIKFLEFF